MPRFTGMPNGASDVRQRKKIVRLYKENKYFRHMTRHRNILSVAEQLLHSPKAVRKYVNIFDTTRQYLSYHERYELTHGRDCSYTLEHLLIMKRIIYKNALSFSTAGAAQ